MYVLSGPTNTKPHCCPEQGPFFDPNRRCPLECGAASTASNQVIHGPILYILKQLPLSVSLNAVIDCHAQPSTGSNLLLLDRLRCIFRATYLLQIRRPPTSRPHSIHRERGIHITQSGTYISSSELSHSTRHQTYGYVIKPNFLYWMILLDASRHAACLFYSYLTSLPGPLRNQCWFSDISASSWSSVPAVAGTKQP